MDARNDPHRTPCCRYCDSTDLRQGPGAGPHHARLVCNDCNRFVKWVAKPKN